MTLTSIPAASHAISMQSACNQHAISMQSTCNQHAIIMQSACNQHAISMQSACNQHAISAHLDPRRLARGIIGQIRVGSHCSRVGKRRQQGMGQGVVGAAEAIHGKALELSTTDSLITIAEAMLQDEGLILECEPSQLASLLWGDDCIQSACNQNAISMQSAVAADEPPVGRCRVGRCRVGRGRVGRCRVGRGRVGRGRVGRDQQWGDTSDEMPASTARELSSSDQPGMSFSFEAPEPKNRTSCPKKEAWG